ncbi:MAG TPA: ABC transporter ATP-binding protein [Gemmatimonadales bacterium]|nr:ABC transporter ATP-binding protein [Gemmatimonadales bacterium]
MTATPEPLLLDHITSRYEVYRTPLLELRGLSKRFGEVAAVDGLSLTIAAGEFLTLLGASGSGKTTTLRMLAGFEQPDAGEILMDGSPITGRPPYRRDINTVFQHYALFPHMSVRQNVEYGLRMKGVPPAERRERVDRALEMVRLADLGGRAPRQLSGGPQQRVALARALVNRPRVLLLDEPLGALDLKLRREMQLELKRLQAHLGITFVYVTHDQEEALTMSDRVVLMRQGRIAQAGTPRELYDRPASRYVADFIGDTNLLPGRVEEAGEGRAVVRVGEARLAAACDPGFTRGRDAWVSIRPEAIIILRGGDTGPGANLLDGRVEEAVYAGAQLRVYVEVTGGARLVVVAPPDTPLRIGETVRLAWAAERGRCVAD